jgi:hypothetical protein
MTDTTFTIRHASADDASAIARLAALDTASPPTGELLLAEVDGELWAAVAIESGAVIADPFRPSGDLVELLHFRAARMRRELGEPARRLRLLPRAA